MATETFPCPGIWPWQWFRTCTRDVPDPPADPCRSPACDAARFELGAARMDFDRACTFLSVLRATSDLLSQILRLPLAPAIVAVVVSAILRGPFGAAIGLAVVVALSAYAVAFVLQLIVARLVPSASQALTRAAGRWANARRDVERLCPEACRGDLTVPTCVP